MYVKKLMNVHLQLGGVPFHLWPVYFRQTGDDSFDVRLTMDGPWITPVNGRIRLHGKSVPMASEWTYAVDR